jgi:cytosine deaminase
VAACAEGADLIGGCPYTDTHPHEQIARIFAIARRFDLDIDFHLDFDLDPGWMHLDEVCRATDANRYGGRVAVGHATKLSAIPPERQIEIAQRLADAGVAVTVLPATDLFLMGRGADHNVPRGVTRVDRLQAHGVTCSLATNNVLNPFTPFGDCSLVRIANLYANIAQLGRREELEGCLAMITTSAAKLMNLRAYGIAPGHPADLVVLPCATAPPPSPSSPAPCSASSAAAAPSPTPPAACTRRGDADAQICRPALLQTRRHPRVVSKTRQ